LIGQSFISIDFLAVNNEVFRDVEFKNIQRINYYLSSSPKKFIFFEVNAETGKFIYRGETPGVGRGYTLNLSATLKPVKWVNLSLSSAWAKLNESDSGEEFFNGNISRANLILNLNAKTFIRTIAEYNSFNDSFNFYPLFSYKMNAFTNFTAGYTNYYAIDHEFPANLRSDQHQFFIKIQYLFRK